MGKPPRSTPRKRPPTPSVSSRRTAAGRDVRAQIVGDRSNGSTPTRSCSRSSAAGAIRSTTREVLSMLRDYNAGRPTLHLPQ
jgi:hypothetical protein